jgi:hypothetical protein
MSNYSGIQKEETFKAVVSRGFFNTSKYAYKINIGNTDFIVTESKTLKGNNWILYALKGSVPYQHMNYYFAGYTFRFSISGSCGKLFYRRVEQVTEIRCIVNKNIAERKSA